MGGSRSDAARSSLMYFDGLASSLLTSSFASIALLHLPRVCGAVRCSFPHHHHQGNGGGYGGGIYAESSTITMTNCVISGNTAGVSRLGCRSDAARPSLMHFDGLASSLLTSPFASIAFAALATCVWCGAALLSPSQSSGWRWYLRFIFNHHHEQLRDLRELSLRE